VAEDLAQPNAAQLAAQLAEKDAQLAAKDAQLAAKDAQLAEKVAQLAETVAQLAEKDRQLAGKDAQLAAVRAQLAERDAQLAALCVTLGFQVRFWVAGRCCAVSFLLPVPTAKAAASVIVLWYGSGSGGADYLVPQSCDAECHPRVPRVVAVRGRCWTSTACGTGAQRGRRPLLGASAGCESSGSVPAP
jgi:hypothetical protein